MKSLLERIESKIKVTLGQCHEWKGSTNSHGYPHIEVKTERGYRMRKVTRLYWGLKKGLIPFGLLLLHRCGNKICLNLDHLYIGTYSNNYQDRIRLGEQPPKLSVKQIVNLINDRVSGMIYTQLAKKYGISKSTASNYSKMTVNKLELLRQYEDGCNKPNI